MKRVLHRRARHQPIQHRGYKTRQKVLNAARKILVLKGYQDARVEEITKLAKVGYGTFYKYFRNKEDVLETLMEEVYKQLNEASFPSKVEASQLEEQIRNGITNYLRVYRKNSKLLLALHPASMMSPRIREVLSEMREKDVLWMLQAFDNLRRQGWTIRGNPEVLSLAMIHTVESVAHDWITRRKHLELEEVADTLSEIWYRTILPSRPHGLLST